VILYNEKASIKDRIEFFCQDTYGAASMKDTGAADRANGIGV